MASDPTIGYSSISWDQHQLIPIQPPMALDPLFTVTFDVASSDNYGQFISNLRHRLANPRHFTHKRPVLPPVEPNVPPRRWFHIVLRTQQAELTLATRADNLYLEGFQSTDGTWWELTEGMIPGATYTRFGGSNYGDLIGDTVELSEVALGPQQMAEAVNVLAGRVPTDMSSGPAQQRAKDALVALLLMVHEATRFVTLSGYVADLMHPRAAMRSGTLTDEMRELINKWKPLSAALLTADVTPPGRFTPFEDVGVYTVEQAANTVGILLFVQVPGGLTADAALKLFREG
ncbi:hypothetical protein PR202_gb12585 [Eleusine coracana subsp. coracana]|uniref:rRNA N-glycosylase n=1 Tax=Eleusine coracana subsp. coracana TaxID=191504 RepID=A0AAV5END5_ELECO|nr:hypothetical protein QOZ80_7BG0590780 [Eleusine coracana subsp. coracana]GJN24819.1 hypothetical protein PR202_gb12585 [Eleusine coracana subsp. coracana]